MDIIKNFYELIKLAIKNSTPSSRQAPDYPCVGTTGCEPNTILSVERNGDFYKFQVKALGKIKPLFTDKLMDKAVELVIKEEYDGIIRLFDIKQEFIERGYEIIPYVFSKWAKLCKWDLLDLTKLNFNYCCSDIDSRMFLTRSDCIGVPIEIINIGDNVVPSEWIGKVFANGKELHSAIDTLDWRRGKPPVTYCCIYSMSRVCQNNTGLVKNINWGKLPENVIIVELDKFHQTKIINKNQISQSDFVIYKSDNWQMIICYTPSNHFISTDSVKLSSGKKTRSVGVLSSTLQKSIRHGACSVQILKETINKLARTRPYNLPEQQYLKVSGARQLLWRLFITCIEDFRYYWDLRYLNLPDILVLAFICNKEPDYVINQNLLGKIIELGEQICLADAPTDYYEWRTYKESKPIFNIANTINSNTIWMAQEFMPKMSGDAVMINKYFTLLSTYVPKPINPNPSHPKCLKCANGLTPKYTGIDIHCYPNMILKLQAITKKTYSTQQLSSCIWELNSKYSNRKLNEITDSMINSHMIRKISNLQKEFWGEYINVFDNIGSINLTPSQFKITPCNNSNPIDKFNKRVLFLKIFGKSHRIPATKSGERVLEVTFSYQDWKDFGKPIQIKYVNSEEYLKAENYNGNIERVYKYFQTNKLVVQVDNCINGFQWIFTEPTVRISLDSNTNPVVWTGLTSIKIPWFDGSNLVKPISESFYQEPSVIECNLINNMLGKATGYNLLDCNRKCRQPLTNFHCINLLKFIGSDDNQIIELLKAVYVKFLTAYDNIVTISQVTRSGEKIDHGVDYYLEGKFWSILNLLHYCYPGALKISGELKYHMCSFNPHFTIMITDIKKAIGSNKTFKLDGIIKNKTNLWTHQEQTSSFIISNISEGKRGFGDASNVGAGKTLTALATVVKLSGFKCLTSNKILVLLPTEKLYKTWTDEIAKHFEGLNWLTQSPDGTTNGKYLSNTLNIYITTMGRNREHPLKFDWLFVIIDECLTVQNKEALQTMEAWKQVVNSQFGVLLLSATFFRTRFDKLLYMLKMLNTGLPETKDYLDTILYDSIKVNLPETKRTWVENVFKKPLGKKFYSEYNKINQLDISNEQKYIKLTQYIRDTVNYIEIFAEYIEQITKVNKKAKLLIYASSKKEADTISQLENVGLYPDISKTHVVVSYANGTYGLNDLIGFNHILSRPPEPDKLPQMKGRLDRPGQKSMKLDISYIILANTIEEAHYARLEICNRFYSNHIMPLSDFYSLAVDVKSTASNKIKSKKTNGEINV